MATLRGFPRDLRAMVRAKKHVSKFPWYEEWQRLTNKYGHKWVISDEGVFWVNTIYMGIGSVFYITLFRTKEYKEGKTIPLVEFEMRFKVIEIILEQVKA